MLHKNTIVWVFVGLVLFSLVAVPKPKRQGMRNAFRSLKATELAVNAQHIENLTPLHESSSN